MLTLRALIQKRPAPAGLGLREGTSLVGRAEDCDVRLDDARVSRHHAVLEVSGGRVAARDLGSRNGLFVNGARVPEGVAGPGDRLSFGPLEFVVEEERATAASSDTVILERGHLETEVLPTDARRLQTLHTIAEALVGSLRLAELLPEVLDCLQGAFSCDRCAIAGRDDEGRLVRWASRPESSGEAFSRSIAARVLDRGEALLCDDIQGQMPFDLGESVAALNIRSVLCSPLVFRGAVRGLVYLDRSVPGMYDLEDLALLRSISAMVAIALENARLYDELRERYRHAAEDLRAAEARLVETERAAALGHLALAVAHEVRNPVTVIGGLSRRLERGVPEAERTEALEAIREESDRLERMMTRVEALIGLPEAAPMPSPVGPAVAEAVAEAGPLFARRGISLQVRSPGPEASDRAYHDPTLTRIGLAAVLEHAAQALGPGGAVEVRAGPVEGGWVVDVADARCVGCPEGGYGTEASDAAPEPWSLDLGLALAQRAMAAQGGRLRLGGHADTGVWVRLVLPTEDL
ncbi:MAG: FHA domain-containing protein [Deltaproteobacteria bacterium]|nr:FHA domain-containing protein [Deltaproteobacteria bacterium]